MKREDAVTHFSEFLRKQHLRKTPERFEILDAILHYRNHFDADELFLMMKNSGSKVSRATVYNTLEKLTECGVVSRYRFGEKLARYELTLGSEHHHHIICQSCGRIEEFEDKRVDRLSRDAARTMGFSLHDHTLHLYGICRRCVSSAADGTSE